MKNLLFDFENLKPDGKGIKEIIKYFTRAGVTVIENNVGGTKRTSGITYKEVTLTMNDSQTVTLKVKQTGDIFQALVNGKLMAIKNQDAHPQAIGEIAKALDAGRAAFQKKLAKALVKLPPSIRTAAPKMEEALIQKRDSLKEAIQHINDEIAALAA
jgi:hypothetical protein